MTVALHVKVDQSLKYVIKNRSALSCSIAVTKGFLKKDELS